MTKMFWYNFDASFIENFEKNIDSLNLQKANQIIADYFPKNNFQFVQVGKSEDIKKITEKYVKSNGGQYKIGVKKLMVNK